MDMVNLAQKLRSFLFSKALPPPPSSDLWTFIHCNSEVVFLIFNVEFSIFYLKGGPKNHITKEYLVPLVTGVTLCSMSEGNTITDPVLLNSGV